MGWFDGFFGQKSNGGDPLGKLDPKLREFLEKESPVKYTPVAATPQQPTAKEKPSSPSEAAPSQTDAKPENGVPQESLFQDGRYAHLWKTYRPLATVEAETKTDHEKLMDVLEGFKERKAQIGRTAMENCALEQMDWNDCMKAGDWGQKFTMCSAEVRKFEKCFTMQSRFLRALGYMQSPDRSTDEDIQMHADKLYHRFLEQEAAIAKAKAEGRPAPEFLPLIAQPPPVKEADDYLFQMASAEGQKRWRERLAAVPEEDRAAEDAAIRAEMRVKAEIAKRAQAIWQQSDEERQTRKKEGTDTFSDKVAALFKTNVPPKEPDPNSTDRKAPDPKPAG